MKFYVYFFMFLYSFNIYSIEFLEDDKSNYDKNITIIVFVLIIVVFILIMYLLKKIKDFNKLEKVKSDEISLLKKKDFFYEEMIENSSRPIFFADLDNFEIITANSSMKEYLGYDPCRINMDDIDGLSRKANEKLAKELRKNGSKRLSVNFKRKNGVPKNTEIFFQSFKSNGKNYSFATVYDLQREKNIGIELKKYISIMEQLPVSVMITDKSGDIEYVNRHFLKITGYNLGEILGKNPRILKSDYHKDGFYELLWQEISSGKIWKGEFKNRKKSGEYFWESSIITPYKEDGKIVNYIAINEDISEKKEIIYSLLEAREKAEMSNRSKSDFILNISHELRTPLSGIIGFIDLLLAKEKESDKIEMLQYINESSEKLLDIVDDILALSRLELDQLKINYKEVNLREIFNKIQKQFEIIAKKKGLDFNVSYDNIIDESFISDEIKVVQVLQSILENAFKFTDVGGINFTINLISDIENKVILEFIIEDSGSGISNKNLEVIFENIKNKNQFDCDYSGISMNIIKKLLNLLKGKILVESKKGKGSKFTLYIPFYRNFLAEGEAWKEKEDEKYDIIIAEDNSLNRTLIRKMLERKKWRLTEVINGEELVEKIKHKRYSLILLDLQMPKMNGYKAFEIIREIERERGYRTPVVAITAYAMDEDRRRCLNFGMDEYLTKPLRKEVLYDKIEVLLATNSKKFKQTIDKNRSL